MSRKTKAILAAVILLIALMASFVTAFLVSKHDITSAVNVICTDRYLAGMETEGNNYYIFRRDIQTGETQYLLYPIMEDQTYNHLQELQMDSCGDIYLICRRQQSDTQQDMEVLIEKCDFQSGELAKVYQLSADFRTDQAAYLRITEDDLLCLITSSPFDPSLEHKLLTKQGETVGKIWAILPPFETAVQFFDVSYQRDIFLDRMGNIYTQVAGQNPILCFQNDGSLVGRDNLIGFFEDGWYYFVNATDQQVYQVRLDTENSKPVHLEMSTAWKSTKFVGENVNITDWNLKAEMVCGILSTIDGRKLPVVYGPGTEDTAIDSLSWGMRKTVQTALIMFLCSAALGEFYLWLIFRAYRQKGGAPVWKIITLVLLPLIIAGYFILAQRITPELFDVWSQEQIGVLDWESRNYTESLDLEKFRRDRDKPYLTPEDLQTYNILWNDIYEAQSDVTDDTGYLLSHHFQDPLEKYLYFYRDGKLYSANSQELLNVPLQHNNNFMLCDASRNIIAAAEEKRAISYHYGSMEGYYQAIAQPIIDRSGEVLGVLVLAEDTTSNRIEMMMLSQHLKRIILLIMALLIIAVQAILLLNFRPLAKLRQAVMAVAEGNLDARVHSCGSGELAFVAGDFDRMTAHMQRQTKGTEDYQKTYQAFAPEQLFSYLSKKGPADIAVGDSAEIRAVFLKVEASAAESKNLQAAFARGEAILNDHVDMINAAGGVIHRFMEWGESCIFPETDGANAISAAVSIIHKSGNRFYIGIADEKLKMGVLGSENRRRLAVISAGDNLSTIVQTQARRFGCSILVTEKVLRQLSDRNRSYSCRLIGALSLQSGKIQELLYEVLDGNSQQMLLRKLNTRDLFEQGVRCYLAGNWEQAHRQFAKVLIRNPQDSAARTYMLLCQVKMQNPGSTAVWLDEETE